jgi:autonomous glycyl radical cofactor GrcA
LEHAHKKASVFLIVSQASWRRIIASAVLDFCEIQIADVSSLGEIVGREEAVTAKVGSAVQSSTALDAGVKQRPS